MLKDIQEMAAPQKDKPGKRAAAFRSEQTRPHGSRPSPICHDGGIKVLQNNGNFWMDAVFKNHAVRMFNVYKAYGKTSALRDISLEVAAGDIVFITGPSGAGKSTLLKLIYKAELASQGQILVDGMNLARITQKQVPELRRRIGVIFQDFKLITARTVYENVALVLEASGEKPKLIEKKVMSTLRTVGIEDKAKLYPPALSGGEQQRVAIARAVVGSPRLILADEPTASLDPQSASHVIDLLATFHGRGVTLMIATHNRAIISRLKGKELRLEGGFLQKWLPAPEETGDLR